MSVHYVSLLIKPRIVRALLVSMSNACKVSDDAQRHRDGEQRYYF